MIYIVNSNLAITAVKTRKAAAAHEKFSSQEELMALAMNWNMERMVATWNALPDVRPVNRFTDRKSAVARIWKAVQGLTPAAVEPAPVAPTVEPAVIAEAASLPKHEAPEPAAEPEAEAPFVTAEPAPEPASASELCPEVVEAHAPPNDATEAVAPRTNKKDVVLALLRRPEGVTGAELMAATGWQAHSVRGFLSGQVAKKMGIVVRSTKREDGSRCYSLQ